MDDVIAGGVPVSAIGMALIVVVWGFFEGFIYVVICDKINGWIAVLLPAQSCVCFSSVQRFTLGNCKSGHHVVPCDIRNANHKTENWERMGVRIFLLLYLERHVMQSAQKIRRCGTPIWLSVALCLLKMPPGAYPAARPVVTADLSPPNSFLSSVQPLWSAMMR